jgi:hypothetical protein
MGQAIVQPVMHPFSIPPCVDKAGMTQDSKMSRYGALGKVQGAGQMTDAKFISQ